MGEEGSGAGGYAKESSEAFQAAQKRTFHDLAKASDIIITTAAIPGRPSPRLIEDYMVQDMRPGSVIVDLAAVGGGNCSLTKINEMYVHHNGVTILGYTDLPSRMARQASDMWANNMSNLLDHISQLVRTDGNDQKGCKKVMSNLKGLVERVIRDGNKPEEQSMEDLVIAQSVVAYGGQALNPPPPPPPQGAPPKKLESGGAPVDIKKESVVGGGALMSVQSMMICLCGILVFVGWLDYKAFTMLLMVFMLSAWVGYMLVWNVQPALHTPLMSVSNAISGQVVLGGIFMVSSDNTYMAAFAGAAIVVASMNVFGGFMVTYKMLAMFRK